MSETTKAEKALIRSRFYGAGVRAEPWTTDKPPSWQIVVQREDTVSFKELDPLKRAVWEMTKRIQTSDDWRLIQPLKRFDDEWHEIEFGSLEDAWQCVQAIWEALKHIQGVSEDDGWREIPSDVFETPLDERPATSRAWSGLPGGRQ